MAPAQGWHAQIENVSLFFLSHSLQKHESGKKKAPRPGIEPGFPAWQAGILTTTLPRKFTDLPVWPGGKVLEQARLGWCSWLSRHSNTLPRILLAGVSLTTRTVPPTKITAGGTWTRNYKSGLCPGVLFLKWLHGIILNKKILRSSRQLLHKQAQKGQGRPKSRNKGKTQI